MEKKKSHLTLFERQTIIMMRSDQKSLREISKVLKRNPSTIQRELKRNEAPPGMSLYMNCYDKAKHAHDKAKRRQREKNRENRSILKKDLSLESRILDLLEHTKLSPEEIAYIQSNSDMWCKISGKTIRRHIKKFYPAYKQYFPHRGKRRTCLTPRTKKRKAKQAAPHKRSIHEKKITHKIGEYELDMIVCSQSKYAILTIRELNTLKVWCRLVVNLKGETVRMAIMRVLLTIPPFMLKTCTYDRGSEFSEVHRIEKLLGVVNYFCDAYCAWQKGSVEQANKEIRRFLPKGTDLKNVTEEELAQIELMLNFKPRKKLDGLSADDAWFMAMRNSKYLLN